MTTIEETDTQIILRTPAVDETGGLTVLLDMVNLRAKRDATAEHPLIRPKTTRKPAVARAPGRFRRILTRVRARIAKAVATVREATAWLFSDLPNFNPKLITRFRNRFLTPKGRHHVRRAWYGVQRSTAASVVITRERHMRAQQTSRTKEGVLSSYYALPQYWVSHMAVLIETIRDEHRILQPSKGRHWQCS